MASDPKHELVELLVREAFEPVLKASPDGRSEHDKKTLEHVQRSTRAEIERYRKYRSAEEVYTNFRRDLTSGAAKKVHAELRHLKLPVLDELRNRFEERARRLGVGAGS